MKALEQLTARRLWLISAPSIFVCLSESLASAALSLPAKSMKEILEKRHSRDDFYGALVYFSISQHFVIAGRNEHWPILRKKHTLLSVFQKYCKILICLLLLALFNLTLSLVLIIREKV